MKIYYSHYDNLFLCPWLLRFIFSSIFLYLEVRLVVNDFWVLGFVIANEHSVYLGAGLGSEMVL
jgi:hypothetical protein